MSMFKDLAGLAKSKMQKASVDSQLHSTLMRDFPEGVVGSKNYNTISNTIKAHIASGSPEKAQKYAQMQKDEIAKQKSQKTKEYGRY